MFIVQDIRQKSNPLFGKKCATFSFSTLCTNCQRIFSRIGHNSIDLEKGGEKQ